MRRTQIHRVIIAFFLHLLIIPVSKGQDYKRLREEMVRTQIQTMGINHQLTLKAMRSTPRHLFVPDRYKGFAYYDTPLPIGYGQTISQPYIVAYMTQSIQPKSTDKVLEIGTGSGYQAAVLAGIVSRVFTIEIVPQLGNPAKKRVADLGYSNIQVRVADGFYGWKEEAPFDAIVVTAAAEYIPAPLIQQLREGGRMIIPVGSPFSTQYLVLVTKKKGGKVSTRTLIPVKFVPFTRSGK